MNKSCGSANSFSIERIQSPYRVHAGGVRVKRMRAPSTLHGSSWMIQIFFFIANGQKTEIDVQRCKPKGTRRQRTKQTMRRLCALWIVKYRVSNRDGSWQRSGGKCVMFCMMRVHSDSGKEFTISSTLSRVLLMVHQKTRHLGFISECIGQVSKGIRGRWASRYCGPRYMPRAEISAREYL